jgi:hypothetical protein
MAERKGYRGIEYSIRQIDDARWGWAVYPKKEEGARFCGCIGGTRDTAVEACKTNIDAWMAAKPN